MTRVRFQNGFILMPVIIAIVLIATIAFMLNNQSAINVNQTGGLLQAEQAEQVAQAGLVHATWDAQNSGCAGDEGMTAVPFGQTGTDNYSATVSTPGGVTTAYPDLAADQDAWFRSDNITNNNGGQPTLHLRREFGNLEYAVVRFDLSTLPAGAQINSATARFYINATKGHPLGPVNVHRVTADWTENGATWETMASNFDSATLNSIPPQPDAGDVWVTVNLTAQVQAWVNGEANYGIMLIPTGEGTHAEYMSRDAGAATRPQLDVIVGTGPATPMTITAVGTLTGNPSPANDITRKLARSNVPAYQPDSNLVLQPDAATGKDAYIWEWQKNTNKGTDDETWVSRTSNNASLSLLKFNMGEIPARSKILSATLSLHNRSGNNSDVPVTAHRITNPWNEDFVTWNDRDSGTAWDTAGGDVDPAAIAITNVGPTRFIRYEWDITSLVQGWTDGAYENYGVALATAMASSVGERFDTSDHADPTRHPRLSITYTCECGSSCLAPQGSGTVAMVVINPSTLVPSDAYKKALFESWGYTVNSIGENTNAAGYMTAATSNDVFFISETVNSSQVGARIKDVPIGVVSQDGTYNSQLGFATGNTWKVGSSINVTDTSHYITALFPTGALDIYSGGMEQLTVSGTAAAGLQTLADTGGAGSLVVLDKGATMTGGGSAAGSRVMLPLGREGKFNWNYLNANGRLMVQRALQWGTGNTGESPKNLLLVVVDPASLTAQEAAKKALIEGWGYTVNLIDESDSQAAFDAALASNVVAYIPETINPANVGTKLTAATIGIVNEEKMLLVELGFSGEFDSNSTNEIVILDNTHWITSGLALGTTTIATSNQPLTFTNNGSAPGAQTLAETNQVGSFFEPSLLTLETNAALFGGGFAAGKRVSLPWGDSGFNINALNADGLMIMQRAIEWAEGAGSTPAPAYNVLLIVGNLTLSSKDVGYKALMESWGHTVTLIDDGDSQANYDTAMAAADVVYASGSAVGSSMLDKATNTTKGLVNEVNGKIDNFGFSSSTAATANFDTFSMTNAAHYITEPFAGNPVTVFTTSLTNPVPGGTLAPDLQNVGEVTGTLALGTLDTGATRYDGNPSQGRRAHLPFASAEVVDMTADGEMILQRTLEWAAGADSGGGGASTAPIAHWKLDEISGLTAVDSAGGHDGTLVNGPLWATGQDGGALDFDGANDEVTVPHSDQLSLSDAFTLMSWIKPGSISSGYQAILFKGNSGDFNWWFGLRNGEFLMEFYAGGSLQKFTTSGAGLTAGNWYHIAASFDNAADTVALYIDGVNVHTQSTTATPDINSLDLLIGNSAYSGEEWDGLLDDVRIYDSALSATEITDLASSGGGGGGGGSCDGTFRDEFNAITFSGSDGTRTWAGDWLEVGESDGPTSGDTLITADQSNYQLRTRDNNNGGEGVEREADLTGAGSATLSYDYRRSGLDSSSDYTIVEISSNGASGPWTELTRHAGSGTDTNYVPASHNISSFISVNTRIRFKTSSSMGGSDIVWFDNIEITCTP